LRVQRGAHPIVCCGEFPRNAGQEQGREKGERGALGGEGRKHRKGRR
jgi:hypothetical protein